MQENRKLVGCLKDDLLYLELRYDYRDSDIEAIKKMRKIYSRSIQEESFKGVRKFLQRREKACTILLKCILGETPVKDIPRELKWDIKAVAVLCTEE